MNQPLPSSDQVEPLREAGLLSRGMEALRSASQIASEKMANGPLKRDQERQLFAKVVEGNQREVFDLLSANVDPMTPTQSRIGGPKAWTPLHQAIANGNENIALALVDAVVRQAGSFSGAKLDVPEGQYGDTPLMMAMKQQSFEIGKKLMSLGADPGFPNKEMVTPFMEVCRLGHVGVAKEILNGVQESQATALLYRGDSGGMNSLFHSIAGPAKLQEKMDLIDLHEANGFDCFSRYGTEGYTALHVASLVGEPGVIRKLMDGRQDDITCVSTKEGLTPMMMAAWSNQPSSVKMLASYPQTDINAKKYADENTALHMAGVRGHCEVIVALADCGADLKAKNNQNQTPEDLCRYLGKTESAQILKALDIQNKNKSSIGEELMQRANQAISMLKTTSKAFLQP